MANMLNQHSVSKLGITSTQARILFLVGGGYCVAAADLARECATDASAVTRILDRLEKQGLVSRGRCQEDRRVVRLVLTPQGQALADRLPPIFEVVNDTLLVGLTAEEVGFLKSLLRRILATTGDIPPGPGTQDSAAAPRHAARAEG
jgi:DNA-binding MarR family transcriptional regulator